MLVRGAKFGTRLRGRPAPPPTIDANNKRTRTSSTSRATDIRFKMSSEGKPSVLWLRPPQQLQNRAQLMPARGRRCADRDPAPPTTPSSPSRRRERATGAPPTSSRCRAARACSRTVRARANRSALAHAAEQ